MKNKPSQPKAANHKAMKKTAKKSTALSSRAVAAQVILQVLDEGKSLSSLIPDVQACLKTQDLPLLQEICFGVCRVLPRLEQIIQQLVDKPLKGKTRIVHCLLLVGLYQLLYMRIPPHAAVDEVVNATKALKSDSFRGLVNGVLRRFLREQESILVQVDKHWQTLHPEWLVNKLKKAYPNWRDIIHANNQKPPMWLRVNTQKNSRETYRTLLEESAISADTASHPQALRLTSPIAVEKLPHFSQGAVTVQDLSAQWAAILLEPQNDEWILDACAAPGGKTTHILELAPQAKVIALDIEAHRLKRVEENLTRLNQQARVVCGDATQPDEWLAKIGQSAVQFDRILLDAPCSATGVIRRHPDIKWLRQETDIAPLVGLQERILKALWAKLKPNGILLYATCSVLPEENSEQIRRFLFTQPDAQLLPLPFRDEQNNDKSAVGFQFIAQEKGGDGFYYAKLRKRA
ncbi:16S rRNA (cytosine(967)-C(5))-methyltransferase [Rodentibacter trehalosifermentans]|uniref:Ribosomal RNA small subunit methyltransferase B n=2 Tax=Rodentibacter trehalosifermentans TaxID=1908263 RepID=A0A1V3IVT8_9PAST|nr:16S rRNA (cytosine(967)-C(5))-methyltransferase RsmB [Rodentibacter trehalosifermentans]OOF46253.1 16S rRNA (cytosine(967)-C(5))-methyltransferase [Rodentibacter trehalosifermentans]